MPKKLKSYLAEDKNDEAVMAQLKSWLRGVVTDDFSITQDPPIVLEMLHSALRLAILDLIVNLDTDMEGLIEAAADRMYGTQVDKDSIWGSRKLDTVGLRGIDFIDRLDHEATIGHLKEAKKELAWMIHEIRRLCMHMNNAREQIMTGWRTSFEYRGLPRESGG